MTEAVEIIKDWGPWGLLGLVVIFVLTNPEKAERVGGWFLGLFSFLGKRVKHRSIKLKYQGQISNFARSVNREVKGSMPYNMKMNFIKEVDRSELNPNKKTVIVCIKDRGNEDKNLVHTMMTFCPIGVIPQARPYLSEAVNEGINITVSRKFLNSLKHYSALQYLYDEVLPSCIRETTGLGDVCQTFDVLDEHGLFTRVVLEEMRDFGAHIESRLPGESHALEASHFIEYVYQVATRPEGQHSLNIGHLGRYISTAFVFIGTGQSMLNKGPALYVDHIKRLRNHGFEKAYLAARGGPKGQNQASLSIDMAERVSFLAERAGLAKRGRSMRYYASTRDGISKVQTLIEMLITPAD